MNRPAALIRPLLIALWLFAVVCLPHDAPAREAATNEAALIKILESPAATVREKADACAELKRKGDARSVSALAGLLTNADLSVSARYVLESMPSSKAGRALIQALGKTCGALQTGIINSLAVRREPAAAGALGKLLASPEPSVAIAAAKALGAIGGSSALKSLQGSLAISTGPLHEADVGAILACAAQLAESGKTGAARKIYEQLYQGAKLD